MGFDGILINEDKIKWKTKESIMKKTRLSERKKRSNYKGDKIKWKEKKKL